MTDIFWIMLRTVFYTRSRVGKLVQYEGGYTDYLEAKQRRQKAEADVQGQKPESEKAKNTARVRNRPEKLKFTYAQQKEFETIDEDIEALEQKVGALEKDMELNATNSPSCLN